MFASFKVEKIGTSLDSLCAGWHKLVVALHENIHILPIPFPGRKNDLSNASLYTSISASSGICFISESIT